MAYIERAYLTEQFEKRLHDDNVMNPVMKVLDALEIIDTAPTADVVEVKHGEWNLHPDGSGTCSNCGRTQKAVWDFDNAKEYCGKCGAKMDGRSDA